MSEKKLTNRDRRIAIESALFRSEHDKEGAVFVAVAGSVVQDDEGVPTYFTARQLAEALEKADRYDDLVTALGGVGSDFVRYLEKGKR